MTPRQRRERAQFRSLWMYIHRRHPTISEDGAKLAASSAAAWFASHDAATLLRSYRSDVSGVQEK